MATSVELRRSTYTGAGIYRTAEGDTRSTLTGIKLQVEDVQESIDRKTIVSPLPGDPDDPFIVDLGSGQDTFTLKGVVTSDATNSVDAVHIMLDLRYVAQFWYSTGLISLIWTDEGDTGVTHTHAGYVRNANFRYSAGTPNHFPFVIQFERGKITA